MARICADATVSEPVRERAMELAVRYWENELSLKASRLLDGLFAQGLLKDEVIDKLTHDADTPEAVRQRALEFVRMSKQLLENPAELIRASWTVVCRPYQPPEKYRRALRQAEAACQATPDHYAFLGALGIAQYRVGQYEQAVQTLARSDEMYSKSSIGPIPSNSAFLAMAQHRLGRTDEARKHLEQLRKLLQESPWKSDASYQNFLREAEELIGK